MGIEELKQEADTLGIEYRDNIGEATLANRIAEAKQPLEVEVMAPAGTNIKVMKASEYAEYSKANGRVMGRPIGTKTKLSTQELRVLINSGWTSEQVKEKHGLDDADLTQVVFKLSKEERREVPIKFGKVVING